MSRYSRNDWLEQGLMVLVERGAAGLTIDVMCQRLNLTKGSFYHHFQNREQYLEAILEFWEERFTHQFITYSNEGKTPTERLSRLLKLVTETHGTSEIAIRAWAHVDPFARKIQERVDRKRIDYLFEQELALWGDERRARGVARLLYTTLIGAQEILPPLSGAQLDELYHLLNDLIWTRKQEG